MKHANDFELNTSCGCGVLSTFISRNPKRFQWGKYYFSSMLAAVVSFHVIIYYVETELNSVAFTPFIALLDTDQFQKISFFEPLRYVSSRFYMYLQLYEKFIM